tara:strand:+ start:4732 stop:4962 length:231 start_codon:yes stop_codon:yes gene_type:complete
MSQAKEIKHYLEGGNKITPLEALNKFGCMRLAAVVHTLKDEGVEIKTKMIKDGKKTFAQYEIKKDLDEKNQYKMFG